MLRNGVTCAEGTMVHVKYQDNSYDYVDECLLDYLIASDSIREFYRPSDSEWVDVNESPTRGAGLPYIGPERRRGRKYFKAS